MVGPMLVAITYSGYHLLTQEVPLAS